MIEIFKILTIFITFSIFTISPLNIFNKINKKIKINFLIFNLIINLNFILLFSLTNLSITDYQFYYIVLLVTIFFFKQLDLKINYLIFLKKYSNSLLIFIFSFLILSINISSNLDFGWDAKYFYFIKSLFFIDGLGLKELAGYENNKWHPHFGSYLWAFFWSLGTLEIEYFGRLIYLFIFCLSTYFVVSNSKDKYLSWIYYFLLLIIIYKYERFSGLQEIIIFSLLIISSKILYKLNFNKNFLNLLILVLIMNLMIWIKAEGIIFSLIILSILLINQKVTNKEKMIIFFSFLLFVFIKYFIYFFYQFEFNAQPYNLNKLFSLSLENYYYRFKKITIYLSFYSFKNPIFLIGVFLTIYLNFYKTKNILLKNFNLYFILNTSFILSAYLFRDLEIVYSLRTTLERIVFTSSGFYVYLIILVLNEKFTTKRENGKIYKFNN